MAPEPDHGAGTHSAEFVGSSRGLVDRAALLAWRDACACALDRSEETGAGGAGPVTTGRNRTDPGVRRMPVPWPGLAASGATLIEVERPDGARLRLHYRTAPPPLATLLRAFWSRRDAATHPQSRLAGLGAGGFSQGDRWHWAAVCHGASRAIRWTGRSTCSKSRRHHPSNYVTTARVLALPSPPRRAGSRMVTRARGRRRRFPGGREPGAALERLPRAGGGRRLASGGLKPGSGPLAAARGRQAGRPATTGMAAVRESRRRHERNANGCDHPLAWMGHPQTSESRSVEPSHGPTFASVPIGALDVLALVVPRVTAGTTPPDSLGRCGWVPGSRMGARSGSFLLQRPAGQSGVKVTQRKDLPVGTILFLLVRQPCWRSPAPVFTRRDHTIAATPTVRI